MGHRLNPFYSDKCIAYLDRLRQIQSAMPLPAIVTVYPTYRCNRNCSFCIMRDMRQAGGELDMSEDTFSRLMAELYSLNARNGIRCLHISGGGEPGLYPHMEHIRQFSGTKVLSTNGTNPAIWPLFDRVRVSLNASQGATYAGLTGSKESEFHATVDAIKTSGHKDIGIGFVLDDCNEFDLKFIEELAQYCNAKWVHIRPASYPRGSAQDQAVRDVVTRQAQRLAGIAERNPSWGVVTEKFQGYWGKLPYRSCKATPLHAVVLPDGRLSVCQDVFETWGNLNEHSFFEAWYSPDHQAAIDRINVANCPRCVLCRANEVYEACVERNDVIMEML
jgi:MoaA/NifB/PqqE/SkfB family radical SAM enzyme